MQLINAFVDEKKSKSCTAEAASTGSFSGNEEPYLKAAAIFINICT